MQSQDTKVIDGHEHIRYERDTYSSEEMKARATDFYRWLDGRRTVRDIDSRQVPREVIEDVIRSASTAPSGAHKQPWTFCAVSNVDVKKQIREAAEKEEYESYHGRMSDRWLDDLRPIATNWEKPFLEEAPWLIVVFKRVFEMEDGQKSNNYYVNESVGIACGFLLTAIHNAGLVTVTHTPSPMNFLQKILERPDNERPYLLLPIGYPKNESYVPNFRRKELDKISKFYE
jgi:nitroreductase